MRRVPFRVITVALLFVFLCLLIYSTSCVLNLRTVTTSIKTQVPPQTTDKTLDVLQRKRRNNNNSGSGSSGNSGSGSSGNSGSGSGSNSGSGSGSYLHKLSNTELDIVVSVYDEDPQLLLQHLNQCCDPKTCRVFMYLGMSLTSSRSHAIEERIRSNHGNLRDSVYWSNVYTPFTKTVLNVDNSWSGSEATAYITYIESQYHDMSQMVAFVHGHVTSWHSNNLCDAVLSGMQRTALNLQAPAYYTEISLPNLFTVRCMSPYGFYGDHVNEDLRRFVYDHWSTWTLTSASPRRITWLCCGQFMTTAKSIRLRPHQTWKNLLHVIQTQKNVSFSTIGKIPWEYLWPVLMDEENAINVGTC